MRRLVFALLLILPACVSADAAVTCGKPHKPPCPTTTTPTPTTTTPPPTTTTPAPTTTPPPPNDRRIAVLLINFSDDVRQPWTTGFIDSLYDGPPKSLADFYSVSSFGQLTVTSDTFGWFTIANPVAPCTVGTVADQADAAAIAAGVDLSLYTNKAYVWPQNNATGACRSTGEMPGDQSWVALQTTCTPTACAARSSLWHEFGHNLALNHASAYNCNGVVYSQTCTASEYGDSFDVMGCCSTPLISNLGRLKVGWIPPAQVVTVTQSSTITVTGVNDPASLVYRVSLGDGNFMYIENRAQRTIYENGNGESWPGGTLLFRVAPDYTVHLANPPDAFPYSYLLDGSPESNTNPQTRGLPVGGSFTANGVTFTNLAFDGINNTVEVAIT